MPENGQINRGKTRILYARERPKRKTAITIFFYARERPNKQGKTFNFIKKKQPFLFFYMPETGQINMGNTSHRKKSWIQISLPAT